MAESLFSSLKNEFCHHHSFATRQEVRRVAMCYIELFYNRRLHQPARAMANFTTKIQPLPAAD